MTLDERLKLTLKNVLNQSKRPDDLEDYLHDAVLTQIERGLILKNIGTSTTLFPSIGCIRLWKKAETIFHGLMHLPAQ